MHQSGMCGCKSEFSDNHVTPLLFIGRIAFYSIYCGTELRNCGSVKYNMPLY